jgi:hypothetical protein
MSNRWFAFVISGIVGLGVVAGYWLASLPKLESYKLLNVAGLFYDFPDLLLASGRIHSFPFQF